MDKFSALADPTRRQIIELLAGRGELSATEISDRFSMTAPAVSQHLKVLREAQLVRMEKRGQRRIYRLDPGAMTEFEVWVHTLATQVEDRFARLDEILEAEQKKGRRKK